MAKKPTIRYIAHLAGVSKSTVSRVLNNSANVDPITRERIQHVIAEQNFVPDLTAMHLARGDRRLIGMLLPALWSFMPEIIRGIAGVVEENGYEIILYSSAGHKDFRSVIDRVLTTNFTSGLLASIHTHSPQHLITLARSGLPVVIINLTAHRLDSPWVSVNNAGGASLATRHLLSLGHERIAFLFPSPDLPCFHDRYHGYCQALREAGIEPDPMLALYDDGSAVKCLQEIQAMSTPPTAIVVGNDYLAYSVIMEMGKLGWRVPEDIAIVGFDDVIPPYQSPVVLTTVRQPFYEIGQCAVEMLLSLLDPRFEPSRNWLEFAVPSDPNQQTSPDRHVWPSCQIQLPLTLTVRNSCGSGRSSLDWNLV
ncbi:LacI family DNA-binding transcriptional regulator [Dictyobacter arantiisoli]|uniref:LacI family transcriptional regulator n=1 Tax=Dictyobacter arantiisoli TaxID=2014874 RepID=A0A5A5TBB5_9CHLR|nr:LacI family DNA-binding transcriptional regulator [Dictyobacter arantiisoli]GCF08525.1 LacI family transcriptional regulator [Dictyobacter arantiisoli]